MNSMHHLKVAAVSASIALFGCNASQSPENPTAEAVVSETAQAAATPVEITPKPFGALPKNLESQQLRSINNHIVLSSESQGLLVLNQQGQTSLSLNRGDIESFAWANAGNNPLISAFDEAEGRIKLWHFQDDQLTPASLALPESFWQRETEALCLADTAQANQWSLITLGEGLARQWLLVGSGQASSQEDYQLRHYRDIPVGGEITSCELMGDQLFVVEQATGLWQIDANPESEAQRQLLLNAEQVTGSLSALTGNSEGWLTLSDERSLFILHSDSSQSITRVSVTEGLEILSAQLKGSELLLLSGDQQLYRATLELPEIKQSISAVSTENIIASAETEPVQSLGDAADDPAIWLNRQDPEASLILATDKRRGLAVYNLQGQEQQFLERGRVNNVDLRYGFDFAGRQWDVAAATNRSTGRIDVFAIDPDTGVVSMLDPKGIASDLNDLYGLCLYQPAPGQVEIFANDKDGGFEHWQLIDNQGRLGFKRLQSFTVAGQPEGCVADDAKQQLYFGIEDTGIYLADINPSEAFSAKQFASNDDPELVADIEGMALYLEPEDEGYLVVSSQGDNAYAIYSRSNQAYLGRFRVVTNAAKGIDGASETDGLDVISAPLGKLYPKGLLVVQDGRNRMPEARQNFKLVDWQTIEAAFDL